MPTPRIAFLGIGLMGYPMAVRLLAAGYNLTVWNRSIDKARRLESFGAQVAQSASEAVAQADITISVLENGPVTRTVLESGVMDALLPGSLWIDMASTQPVEARRNEADLAERGVDALDAPVSGGTLGAQAGTLAIMVGGSAVGFEHAQPVFRVMGTATHVGPAGAGQLCKLANQLIVGITIGAVAEALLLVRAGGGDPAKFKTAITGGFADSKIAQIHGQRMLDQDFAKRGAMSVQLKDMRNVMAECKLAKIDLPISNLLEMLYAQACKDEAVADLDHSALYLHLAQTPALRS